jgi:DNA-binding transcriptional LysR family regulator
LTRKIGALALGLHAHPRYLAGHGAPSNFDELVRHPIIGFDRVPSIRRLPRVAIPLSRDLFAFRCDSDIGQYAALRAGFGIGFCQVALAKRDGLVPILRDLVRFDLGVWVAMHKDLKSNRRVRLLFDHLADHLRDYVASEAH